MKTFTVRGEAGFSLIELLTITFLLGVLSSLAMIAFGSYKQSAEMAKGDGAYHLARTKMAISELDLPEGFTTGGTLYSATDGSQMTGDLGTIMPQMSPGKNVRIGAVLAICDGMSDPLDINQVIVVEPCKTVQKIEWTKFCGGIEVLTNRMSNPTPCV